MANTRLSAWERVEIARNPKRKTSLDYIEEIFDDFIELHGDRNSKDDKAIVCGLAKIGKQNFTIIAEQKGRTTKENIERNFGMPNPESYRKAIRFMKQAEKFKRPVITFIDTKGAYPGIEAEEKGQGEAIAKSMFEMAKLRVPIISIVIGEGSSGGALAIGVANKVLMLENAIYSILSPEGYSSILWKDASRFKEAAEKMKLTAKDLYELNIIDKIIPEKNEISEENFSKTSEILKKEMGDNLKEFSNQEKAMVIMALRDKYPVKSILEVFDMAKSSYCYQQKQIKKENKIAKIKERIKILFFENHKRYGYRRIHLLLKREGIIISEKIVRSIMKEENLIVRIIRQKKYSSYLGEISPAVPNEIQRDFHADKPNKKWLTDITEFKIGERKVYLSPIIDCFDGMPITWTVGTSPNAELVNTMLDNAIVLLKENEHPIVHSDRGCHYRWSGWIQRMDEAGLTRSMSKKGCSPDNSACEGFFGRMKNEMFYGEKWDKISVEEFISIINQYMQWYRDKRIKLSLEGLSPMEYRRSLGIA